jgi:hypothetical protein
MAIIHQAVITPSKLDVIEQWLDQQPWGGSGPLEQLGSYRFDDPDGEVGIEAILVRRGDAALQAALTYRSAALDGADDHLIATIDHSVLGRRWVYDAAADPVAARCFERSLTGAQQQAELEVWAGGRVVGHREPTVTLSVVDVEEGDDSGLAESTGASAPAVGTAVRIARTLGNRLSGQRRLVATWAGGAATVAALE